MATKKKKFRKFDKSKTLSVKLQPEELKTINVKLESFSSLIKKEYRLLYLENFNRDLIAQNVKDLKRWALTINRWMVPVDTIPALEFLHYHPNTVFIDSMSKEIIPINEVGPRDYVVMDGQHRSEAHYELLEENPDLGFDLRIERLQEKWDPEIGYTPMRWIQIRNSTGRSWSFKDQLKFVNNIIDNPDTVYYHANILVKEHGLGLRNALCIYTLQDKYKKKLIDDVVKDGTLHPYLKGTKSQIKRGNKIWSSLCFGFRGYEKLLKRKENIDFMIEVYNQTDDDEKAEIINKLCNFFETLSERIVIDLQEQDPKFRVETFFNLWENYNQNPKTVSFREKLDEEACVRNLLAEGKTEEEIIGFFDPRLKPAIKDLVCEIF